MTRRIGRRILATLALVAGGALVLESLFRMGLWAMDRPHTAAGVRTELRVIRDRMSRNIPIPERSGDDVSSGRMILHPYSGYTERGNASAVPRRLQYYRTRDPAQTYAILILGGSVAGRFAHLSAARFISTLEKDPRFRDRMITLESQCVGGYKQPQQATILAYLLAIGYRPDAVINIDGYNEVALAASNLARGVSPHYPSVSHWGHLVKAGTEDPERTALLFRLRDQQQQIARLVRHAETWHLERSAVLSRLVIARLSRIQHQSFALYERYVTLLSRGDDESTALAVHGPSVPGTLRQSIDEVVSSWKESSLSIHSMCTSRHIHYLHVLQPNIHDAGSKPVTDEERRKARSSGPVVRGVRMGYPKLRRAGVQLTASGVEFTDQSLLFADLDVTVYFDNSHFGGVGLDRFADAIAEAFLRSLPPAQASGQEPE